MQRTLIKNTPEAVDKHVLIEGHVHSRRDHGRLIFFDIRDRTGLLQVVVSQKEAPGAYEIANNFHPEDAVSIKGIIAKRGERFINPRIVSGTVELQAREAVLLSSANVLPFDMGQEVLNLELPTLLDYRALTLRHPRVQGIFRVQSAILEGFRNACKEFGCTEIVTPTIAASATEGGAEVFSVDYYGHNAYLTQSPQLYKQIMVPVFERVFTISHAYRAEPSVTTRHLAETTQMDCEFGFVSFAGLMDLYEGMAEKMLKHVEKECADVLSNFGIKPILFNKIPRLKLIEAQEIIYTNFGRDVRGEKDLSPQDEIDICTWARDEKQSDFVTITHFPTKKRAFYTMPDPENPEYSLSYDLLFRGVEILSGSQRIHDYEHLKRVIKERGLDPEAFELYLQAFRYGCPPEGGFSFGLERLTMKVLELANIREGSLFPRDMERVDERFSVIEEKTKKIQKHK